MNFVIYDPVVGSHEYLTKRYFVPLYNYFCRNSDDILCSVKTEEIKNSVVLSSADHLTPEFVSKLKNNGNKIVGFSVTDSSYVSQACRAGEHLKNIDLMFMLTGIQKVNYGFELVVDGSFNIGLEQRQFLPGEDWAVFNAMREAGRLQSLPYVHWEPQADVTPRSYDTRSQKVLIRGGHHMRRFILALFLMRLGQLDTNSGFVTSPYFQNDMNPQFRYCEECRNWWAKTGSAPKNDGLGKCVSGSQCTNPNWKPPAIDLSDLGSWNNKCPASFYAAADLFNAKHGNIQQSDIDKLMNARWLPQREHLEMLARITFTSDLKWLFSIYAAQRFWDAAQVGCINLLPWRTDDQEYFPKMYQGQHYVTYNENMITLCTDAYIDSRRYETIAKEARALYDDWMKPTEYKISTNLLTHIVSTIRHYCG